MQLEMVTSSYSDNDMNSVNPMRKNKSVVDFVAKTKQKHHKRNSTQMPPEWDKHRDDHGQRYYSNKDVGSTWTAPAGATGGSTSVDSSVEKDKKKFTTRALRSEKVVNKKQHSKGGSKAEPVQQVQVEVTSQVDTHVDPVSGRKYSVDKISGKLWCGRACEVFLTCILLYLFVDFLLGESKWIDEEETEETEAETHIDPATGQKYTVDKISGELWTVKRSCL